MEKVNGKPNWVRGSCIGRGSFGTVNLAVDKFSGRVFAVKSVDRNLGLDCQIEALENEIQILRSISSPFVVEYLGDDETFESGGATMTRQFPTCDNISNTTTACCRNLHMEYLPGGTVAELGKCSGADEISLRSYVWCIVSALRYIHAKGIVHCDVKGRNVLVGSTPGTAKLADFGSAVQICMPIDTPRGSPLWMAPEVVRGEYQGPESDIWSLGCTLIEIFTGKPAWEDRGVDTILKIGYSGELPEFPAQLSELGRDFLEKCLRRDPGERWSCDQLLQHPFLLPCSPDGISDTKWSPRCVFDWSDSNISDEEEEEEVTEISNFNVKCRIGKLASTRGANWESEGWVEVRNLITKRTEEVQTRINSVNDEPSEIIKMSLTKGENERCQYANEGSNTQAQQTDVQLNRTYRPEFCPNLKRVDEGMCLVYSDSIENNAVIWRAKWENYSDFNASSSCSPREKSSDHICRGASGCAAGSSCKKEAISYSCYQIVVLLLLVLNFFMYYDYTYKDNIINKQSFDFMILQFVGCLVTCD